MLQWVQGQNKLDFFFFFKESALFLFGGEVMVVGWIQESWKVNVIRVYCVKLPNNQ